jgi:ubiquinol-cytochrome c reductase cytochrome c1 subunit
MKSAAFLCLGTGLLFKASSEKVHAWAYRDDIGAFWGIKGYEE